MAIKFKNGKFISPCIISKVRYALKLKSIKPQNSKKCSKIYWDNVVVILGNNHNITKHDLEKTKADYEKFIS